MERTCADHLLTFGKHASGCISSMEVVGGVTDVPFVFELRGTEGSLSITGGHPGGYQAGPLVVTTNPPSPASARRRGEWHRAKLGECRGTLGAVRGGYSERCADRAGL